MAWNSSSRLDWLVSKPPDYTSLYFPSPRITSMSKYTGLFFALRAGIELMHVQ